MKKFLSIIFALSLGWSFMLPANADNGPETRAYTVGDDLVLPFNCDLADLGELDEVDPGNFISTADDGSCGTATISIVNNGDIEVNVELTMAIVDEVVVEDEEPTNVLGALATLVGETATHLFEVELGEGDSLFETDESGAKATIPAEDFTNGDFITIRLYEIDEVDSFSTISIEGFYAPVTAEIEFDNDNIRAESFAYEITNLYGFVFDLSADGNSEVTLLQGVEEVLSFDDVFPNPGFVLFLEPETTYTLELILFDLVTEVTYVEGNLGGALTDSSYSLTVEEDGLTTEASTIFSADVTTAALPRVQVPGPARTVTVDRIVEVAASNSIVQGSKWNVMRADTGEYIVSVNLGANFRGQNATFFKRTAKGKLIPLGQARLGKNGRTTIETDKPLRPGQKVRVQVDGKFRSTVTIP